MLYVDFTANSKQYKLRLNTRNIVSLEKQLGCNPLAIFGDGDTIPTVSSMVAVLHASLQQYQHSITLNDAYDIFDKWIEDGNNSVDFVKIILEIYKVSGLVPNSAGSEEETETEKN